MRIRSPAYFQKQEDEEASEQVAHGELLRGAKPNPCVLNHWLQSP